MRFEWADIFSGKNVLAFQEGALRLCRSGMFRPLHPNKIITIKRADHKIFVKLKSQRQSISIKVNILDTRTTLY